MQPALYFFFQFPNDQILRPYLWSELFFYLAGKKFMKKESNISSVPDLDDMGDEDTAVNGTGEMVYGVDDL